MPAPRVLLAADDFATPRLSLILEDCVLRCAWTTRDLQHALACERFDLVVIDLHFDASRALEALERAVRARPRCPILCVVTKPARFERPGLDAYHLACVELGATGAVDLTRWPDDDAGNARLRELFDAVLNRPPGTRLAEHAS